MTPPQPPPADVEQAARQRGFGALIHCRALPNPLLTAMTWLGVAVVSFALVLVIAEFGAEIDRFGLAGALVHAAAFFFFLVAVYGVAVSVRHLVVGPRSYWVFDNGFVHRRRSGVDAVGWGEVQRLAPVIGRKGDTAGKILRYDLVPATGKPIPVPLVVENGRDPFMDALMGVLDRHGRPTG